MEAFGGFVRPSLRSLFSAHPVFQNSHDTDILSLVFF
jgi:hypothetical protein